VLSRFFAGFDSAGTNLRCFRSLWRWCLERLATAKEGYTPDLDSTSLLHEDGHQEGVAVTALFQRHLGWQEKVTMQSLRFWLFVTAGVLSHPGGKTTVKLAVPSRERAWWRRLWGKILNPFPNCKAVENRPAFASQIL
jgi:hypothetical protein